MSLLMFTGRIEGMALHLDSPIPPPTGPRRWQLLHSLGMKQLDSAKHLYSQALDRLGCQAEHGFDSPHAPWWVYPPTIAGNSARCRSGRTSDRCAEVSARDALDCAVRAFNLMEDLPEAEDAHRLIHELGMCVSRHFGCRIRLTNDLWRWQCPVIIAHVRIGQSVNFTAQRICSICRQNIMSDRCPHLPNQAYEVKVNDPARCPCGARNCMRHKAGTALKVFPTSIVEEADSMSEISWVARPRDPLARIRSISYSPDQMAASMCAEIPNSTHTIECLHCRQTCTGLWDCEVLGALLNREQTRAAHSAEQATGRTGDSHPYQATRA